ncbi:flagellar protein FlaG [Clostridium sp. BJN0001]|uniref:flagellar protein FlaG n=1 Tax=Clostridium sp. BJN0001 TaxID=2930219 RepID=UPI001FD2E5C5|nr:flagellar protein FlaG [Clostridium sp. BJN0001]
MDVNSIAKSSVAAINTYNNNQNNISSGDLAKESSVDDKTSTDKKINAADSKKYDKEDLEKAVNKLNKFLEDDNTRAEFSYHKQLGTLMVKVVDQNTKKVLLEVPPEKILDMVASMCEQFGIIDKKA